MTEKSYCKRLIEVDLPIRRISLHSGREKSSGIGSISPLHTWWARRPLSACRAVACAALWFDPVDPLCPDAFRATARQEMERWATEHLGLLSAESFSAFTKFQRDPTLLANGVRLRQALLSFISDVADPSNGLKTEYIETVRKLTLSAHQSSGHEGVPIVVDPFAGGGAIPIEAARIGAEPFAADLNPIPILLNQIALQYVPKYGPELREAVRVAAAKAENAARKRIGHLYGSHLKQMQPIAYLWARTIRCEGPACGVRFPLIRTTQLSKHASRAAALHLKLDEKRKRITASVIEKRNAYWYDAGGTRVSAPASFAGTVSRGSARCPVCSFTTPVSSVRTQLTLQHGGAADAIPLCVVVTRTGEVGRFFVDAGPVEEHAQREAIKLLESDASHLDIPDEELPPIGTLGFRVQRYGITRWRDLFLPRQLALVATFADEVRVAAAEAPGEPEFKKAVLSVLACVVDRLAEHQTSLCRWNASAQKMQATFGRQALPLVFDFCEANPFGGSVGSWANLVECAQAPFTAIAPESRIGQVVQTPAQSSPLPDDSAAAFFTDPPYYDAVPYADLSDFFFVWLRRMLPHFVTEEALSPKKAECIVDPVRGKSRSHYEGVMTSAMAEGRRVLAPDGIGIVVFAHKSTAGWEAQLRSMIDAGWIITASWPLDTELATRLRAMDSAALASSVHLVCRPREDSDGHLVSEAVGDWRAVLAELPLRIREWMPRLASEGIVGADAIFACLGPALEVFSKYSRVEKASGDTVPLSEYLEHVWSAVAKQALSMVLESADATGLEPDGRLTAIWLWTLSGGTAASDSEASDDEADDDDAITKKGASGGFALEFDAARKLAQGLGAHLESMGSLVEIRGDTARLLPVTERARYLFVKPDTDEKGAPRKKRKQQSSLFAEIDALSESESGSTIGAAKPASTTLNRIHQSMILFGAGRGEALKRFLIEEGVGNQPQFWKLAQSLSALYPTGTDEKRWVDGVLARKKSFGFA